MYLIQVCLFFKDNAILNNTTGNQPAIRLSSATTAIIVFTDISFYDNAGPLTGTTLIDLNIAGSQAFITCSGYNLFNSNYIVSGVTGSTLYFQYSSEFNINLNSVLPTNPNFLGTVNYTALDNSALVAYADTIPLLGSTNVQGAIDALKSIKADKSTTISAGSGLTGGGDLSANRTISLAAVGSAGTYGSATQSPVFTTDAYGRVTSVTNTTISGVSPGGSASGDLSGTYPSPTVSALQGYSVGSVAPSTGQVLTWNGSAWVPGANTNGGGSGGGGITYFLRGDLSAQSPITGLPDSPLKLSLTADPNQTSYTSATLSTGGVYDLVKGFVTDAYVPDITSLPAGIWDFNVWALTNVNQVDTTIFRVKVYKYNGGTTTLLGTSSPVYLYNPKPVPPFAIGRIPLISEDPPFKSTGDAGD